jgi:hypothetical protein
MFECIIYLSNTFYKRKWEFLIHPTNYGVFSPIWNVFHGVNISIVTMKDLHKLRPFM